MKLNRRDFLFAGTAAVLTSSTASAGTASAENVGPLAAADSPLLSKVKLTSHTVEVGAAEPFKTLHCSDTHLNFMDAADLLNAQVENDLAMYCGRRAQYEPLVPFAACVLKARLGKMPLLHTGDVWDYHSHANCQQAKAAFDAAGDVFYAIGNHELAGHWKNPPDFDREKVREEVAPSLPNDTRFASRVMHGVNFLAFDNANADRRSSLVSDQLAFFKREFAKGLPVVLMCHLPFSQPDLEREILTGEGPFREKYERRRRQRGSVKLPQKKDLPGHVWGIRAEEAKLKNWLLAQPNLKAVLCGHVHAPGKYRLTDGVTEYVSGAGIYGEANEITFV